MDVFSIGLQLAFAAVFVVVLQRYLRDRRPVHRDLLFVAGSVVGWFALSTLNTLVPAIGTSVVRLSAIFIFIQPVLTLRLVRHFVPVRRNLVLAAAGLQRRRVGRRVRHRHAREPDRDGPGRRLFRVLRERWGGPARAGRPQPGRLCKHAPVDRGDRHTALRRHDPVSRALPARSPLPERRPTLR